MKKLFFLGWMSILFLTGCSQQANPTELSLFDQWEQRNFETNPYVYIPQDIPGILSGYTIPQTYTHQMKDAVLFKNPRGNVGYVFEFIGEEKKNAEVDVSVSSGEVEIKIQSLEIGENSKNDSVKIIAGEQKHISLSDYYATSPEKDDVQIVIINALSEYAILEYEISI